MRWIGGANATMQSINEGIGRRWGMLCRAQEARPHHENETYPPRPFPHCWFESEQLRQCCIGIPQFFPRECHAR